MTKSSKVAILSLPYGPNYGCLLQQWALFTYVKQNGYDVKLLNRRWNRKKTLLGKIKTFFYLSFCIKPFSDFYKTMNHSVEIRSSNDLSKYISQNGIDTVIVGSDQIWRIENTRGADLNFFCDFVSDGVKKIAYAASFGNEKWMGSDEETLNIRRLIQRFHAVSVREKSGVCLCEKIFGQTAKHVVDPTLLLNESDYRPFISKKKYPFLGTYILDNSEELSSKIKNITNKLNVKEIALYPRKKNLFGYKSVAQWLSCISNSDYMVIDSFHGLVFSIIFHKQFLVLANKHRGETRISSFLSDLGLEDRLVYDLNEESISLLEKVINYDLVEIKLSLLKEKSRDFLLKSLGA